MNDLHRTGCGCVECGPRQRDPVTFEWPEERDEVLTYEGVLLVVRDSSDAIAESSIIVDALFGDTLARIIRGD